MSSGGSGVLARAVIVLGGDSSELDKVMTEAQGKMMKVGETMKETGETLTTHLTIPLVALGTLAVKSYADHVDVITQLNAMLVASGNIVGTTSAHLQELGMKLQETTTYSHDVTDSAMGMLLSFQDIRDETGKGNAVFDRTITVAQDLATLMGRDLNAAAFALGKTMEDPATGMMLLRRAGIVLSQQVQQQIKEFNDQGRVLEAQKLVLSEVEKRVGGLSAAMAKTPMGQFHQAWNDIHMMLESFGEIMMKVLGPIVSEIREWTKELDRLSVTQKKIIIGISAFIALLGPLAVGLGTALTALVSFSVITGVAAAPLVALGLAVAVLGATVVLMTEHWSDVKLQVLSFWMTVKEAFYSSADFILGKLQDIEAGMGGWATLLARIPGTLGDAFRVVAPLFDAAAAGIQTLRDSLKASEATDMKGYAAALAAMNKEIESIGAVAVKAGKKTGDAFKNSPRIPSWQGPVTAAYREYSKSMDEARKKSEVLHGQFDFLGAQLAAQGKLVDAVSKTWVGLDTNLGFGATLRTLTLALQKLMGNDAMAKLYNQLQDISLQAGVLGDRFDWLGATISAYQTKITELLAAHYSLDQVIGDTGMTVRGLFAILGGFKDQSIAAGLSKSLDNIAASEQALGAGFDAASAKAAAYHTAVSQMIADHVNAKIVTDEMKKTLGDLIATMNQADDIAKVSGALRGVFTGATDAAVAFAFGAKTAFQDWARSALEEIAKVMLQILALRALKSIFGENSDIFAAASKVLLGHANGGTIGPGQLGIVGERGPELMMGGRLGATITPLASAGSGSAAGSGNSGDVVNVHLAVSAIDQAGVAGFFEQNTELVAGAMSRAFQRSSVLRRQLGAA